MSRIAKKVIIVPDNVHIIIKKKKIIIQNNDKLISHNLNNSVIIKYENNILSFSAKLNNNYSWMQAGTLRSIINSMIIGVTSGFQKKLKLIGVGYRINIEKNNIIVMHLGYSHIINYVIPDEIIVKIISPTEVVLYSINKQLLGQVAADLRKKKPPESYKGKGIRYENEVIKIKEAKKK